MSLVRELNTLREAVRLMEEELARLEAHDGSDGTAADIDRQCALVDEIAVKTRRIRDIRKALGYIA